MVAQVREATRGRYKKTPGTPDPGDLQVSDAPAGTAESDDLLVPEAPAEGGQNDRPAGASGTDIPAPAGASGTDLQVPQAPATDHRPIHNNDRPTTGALRTAVTGPRDPEAVEEPDFPSDALPERCAHGLASRRRPDGQPSCALCRRELADTRLAPVIPIRSAS